MKEHYANLSDAESQITQASDIFLVNALSKLKEDVPALNAYTAATKDQLYGKVVQEHSDTFTKNYNDLTNASNTNKNVMYYYIRNKDLNKIQGSIASRAESDAMAAQHDSHLAKRQFEINEWTNGNKLDTLFVFQLIFIGLLISAPLLYIKRLGLLPSSIFYAVVLLIFLAILFTIVIRAQYTLKSRDQRFWHKRRFPGPPVAPPGSCPSASDILGGIQGLSDDVLSKARESGSNLYNFMESTATTSGFQDYGMMGASLS